MVVFQILLSWSPLKVALPEMYDAIKVQGERCIESNKFEEHARDRASNRGMISIVESNWKSGKISSPVDPSGVG